jgi:hypothetical protein
VDLRRLVSASDRENGLDDLRTRLASSTQPELLQEVLGLAQDPSVSERAAREAGMLAARIMARQGNLADAPLWDFTGAAYLAFDETVARIEQERG